MDLLLILTYAALAYATFRIFKIPVNAFTLLTAVLGGVALLGALLLGMNYNHPFSSQGRFYFITTPIVPTVGGRVVEVPVQTGVPLKAGDVLFRIDPERYENAVKALEAQLAAAEQGSGELRAAAESARQKFEAVVAERAAAEDVYNRSKQLMSSGSISAAQFKQVEERLAGASSNAEAAQSEATRAELAATSVVAGVNTDVARIQADLDTARYNLEQTTVRAPTDGSVVQMFLRPGMYAVPMPLRPVMVFLHSEEAYFAAAFLQNSAQRLIEGADAEIILPSVPGRFFKGKVARAGAYIPQGQMQPTGALIDPEQIKGEGRVIVQINLDEDITNYHVPPGSVGSAAIYTEHMPHLSVLRKVLLRMKSWSNFFFGDGH